MQPSGGYRTRDRRLRAPLARVTAVDPLTIGVGAATDGDLASHYLSRRPADAQLDTALAAALSGDKALVIVDGPPVVGKTRTLFEALRRYDMQVAPLRLAAPRDLGALRALLDPTYGLSLDGAAVLWLDAILPFLRAGLVIEDLIRWKQTGTHRIIAATRNNTIYGSLIDHLNAHTIWIRMRATTDDELSLLTQHLSEDDFKSARRHGLAAYLIGGHLLEEKLLSLRHPGDTDSSPEGAAIAIAAVDWQRTGRGDQLSTQALRNLWPAYLDPAMALSSELFASALTWALRPVAPSLALLEESGDGYRATDYTYWIHCLRDSTPVRDAVWAQALQTTVPFWAFMVGLSAHHISRWTDAVVGLRRALDPRSTELPLNLQIVAWGLLGEALQHSGELDDAVSAFQCVVDLATGQTDSSVFDPIAATALVSMGNILLNRAQGTDTSRAIAYWQKIIDRWFPAKYPAMQLPVVNALGNTAYVLSLSEHDADWRAAIAMNQQIIDDYVGRPGPSTDADLRERIAVILLRKGELLQRWNRPDDDDQALGTYGLLIKMFGEDPEAKVRDITDDAIINGALILNRRNDRSDMTTDIVRNALHVCDQRLAARGSHSAHDVEAANRTASTLLNKAAFECHLGLVRQARTPLHRIVSDYGRADSLPLRRTVATALFNDAMISKHFEDLRSHAFDCYRRIVSKYSQDNDPTIQHLVLAASDELRQSS